MQQESEAAVVHSEGAPAGLSAPGPSNGAAPNGELHELLRALQAMRMGDFSVRMAGESTGLLGKIADTFNEIVSTNQHMAQPAGARRPGRRQGGADSPTSAARLGDGLLGRDGEFGQLR